jgi:hypothetical protein
VILHHANAEVPVSLLADRFLLRGDTAAIDLSTGDPVRLIIGTQGASHEQARWAARCARLFTLRHPALARLVDYGATGETRRFEAWRGVEDVFREDESTRAQRGAEHCWRAAGLVGGPYGGLLRDRGRAVAVPGPEAGYEDESAVCSEAPPDAVPPLQLIPRASTRIFGDLLQQEDTALARPLSLWGAPGAGVPTALLDIARMARLQGIVPICARMATPEVCARLRGRSLLIVAREDPASA